MIKRLILTLIGLFLLASSVFATNIYFKDQYNNTIQNARPWQEVTIVLNKTSISNHTTQINSSSGSIISILKKKNNKYQTNFFPNEDKNINGENYLKVLNGTNIFIKTDYATASILFTYKDDFIQTFSSNELKKQTNSFDIDSSVHVTVSSKIGLTPAPLIVKNRRNETVNVSLSSVQGKKGLYAGTFKISKDSTSDSNDKINSNPGENITLISDIKNTGIQVSSDIKAKDSITIYEDTAFSKRKTYFKNNQKVYVEVKNYAWANDSSILTKSINVNSTLDSSGISVDVVETSPNSNIYQGNFTLAGSSNDNNDQIKIGNNVRFFAHADLDNNDKRDAYDSGVSDTKAPSSVSVNINSHSYVEPDNSRKVKITIEDNVLCNGNITVYYWRENQSEDLDGDLELDQSEGTGVLINGKGKDTKKNYTLKIDDSMLKDNQTVHLWIEGSDRAGNKIPVSKSGNETSPLLTYYIDNSHPYLNVISPAGDAFFDDRFSIIFNATDNLAGINFSSLRYKFFNSSKTFLNGSISKSDCYIINKTQNNLTYSVSDSYLPDYPLFCNASGFSLSGKPYGFMKFILSLNDKAENKETFSNDIAHRENETTILVLSGPKNVTVKRGETKIVDFSLNNTGTSNIENISVKITGYDNYSILEKPKKIEVSEKKSMSIEFYSSERSSLKAHNVTVNILNSTSFKFSLIITLSKTERDNLTESFNSLLKKKEEFLQEIDNLKENNEDVNSVKANMAILENKIDSLNQSINQKNYKKAFEHLATANNYKNTIKSQLSEFNKNEGIFNWILPIVTLIVILILVYLFWPTPGE